MQHKTLSITLLVTESWSLVKAQLKFFALATFAVVTLNFLLQSLGDWFTNNGWLVAESIFGLVRWAIQLYVGVVTISVAIRAARGEQLHFDKALLVTDKHVLIAYFLASLLYGLIVFGGVLLLIIPGIIWGIMYSLATYLVVDKGLSSREALRESKHLTEGSRMKLFLLGLATGGINILGGLCLGIGLLVTIPLTLIMSAMAYDILSGREQKQSSVVTPPTPVVVREPQQPASELNQYQI